MYSFYSLKKLKLIVTIFVLIVSTHSYGFSLEGKISNLFDVRAKKKIELNKKNLKAIVFFNYLAGCPIVRKYLPELKIIKKNYGKKILLINLDSSLHAEKMLTETIKHLKSTNNEFPLIVDYKSELALYLKLTTASEVVVVDTRDYKVKYKGAIDDRITLSYDRLQAKNKYLLNTLDSILAEKNIEYSETEASGCLITLFEKK